MYSAMQNKSKNKPNSQSIRKQRPKPEWTTDFVDREQYKLTEVERIQKKASLQSKNREQARRQLQERRKKLQMGIIDDQTRKIYETALISKNIDINPPLRRNLTEMIRYEKQQKQKMMVDEENYNGSDNQEELDEVQQSMKDLKEAQNFIKKFQRAKKQQKIERAVQILSSNKSIQKERQASIREPQNKMNNFFSTQNQDNSKSNKSSNYNPKGSNKSQSFSQDDALSSIEDTIRFMEEKLFAAKKTVDEHSKSFISDVNQSFENQRNDNIRLEQKETVMPSKPVFKKAQRLDKETTELKFKTQDNFSHHEEELKFGDRIGQISQLKIKLKDSDGESSDDECLDTIRRMRELMQNKESDYENYENKKVKQNIRDNFTPSAGSLGFNSAISKRSYQSAHDSEAEVSFNLTMNDDELQQQSSIFNITKSKFKPSEIAFSKNQPQKNLNMNKDQKPLKKQSKQDEYEEQYQKIKQNLFSCIDSNNDYEIGVKQKQKMQANKKSKPSFNKFNEDSDEEDQSEDSLMVQDKINMWKKELEHQVDPDKEDEEENINFKTTTFTKKPQQFSTKTLINKQQEDDEQEEDEPYRYNYLSHQKNQNKNSLNNYQLQYTNKQSNDNFYPNKAVPMKKPPMAKKTQNSQKFEEMKKMISTASSEIHKIQIQPLKIQPLGGGQVLGFDFRGSINIKKNILSK